MQEMVWIENQLNLNCRIGPVCYGGPFCFCFFGKFLSVEALWTLKLASIDVKAFVESFDTRAEANIEEGDWYWCQTEPSLDKSAQSCGNFKQFKGKTCIQMDIVQMRECISFGLGGGQCPTRFSYLWVFPICNMIWGILNFQPMNRKKNLEINWVNRAIIDCSPWQMSSRNKLGPILFE